MSKNEENKKIKINNIIDYNNNNNNNKNNNNNENNNNENNIKYEPIKPYLLETVIPVIQKGLMELDKNRPDNPLEFLGKYLLSNANH